MENIPVTCPHCQERYLVNAERIPSSGGRFTCRICGEKVPVQPSDMEVPNTPAIFPYQVCCPQCGARFVPQPAAAGPARPHSSVRKSRRTILVVEDTEFFLELARDVLGQRYRTLVARSSAEAVEILKKEHVDLLVLDLALADGMDGLAVIRAFPVKPCPVLIFTSKRDESLYGSGWEDLRRAGADDLLQKGMNVEDEMLEKVARLLASSRVPA